MISHKHRFIFIEVPKTGTTTICSILKNNFDAVQPYKHLDIEQYKEKFPKETSSYFKFSFVRNPWSRVVSLYHRKEGMQMKSEMTFSEFVGWIRLATDTCIMPTPKKYMIDFFKIDNKLKMDFIGKFENLQEDFNTICDKIGIPQQQLSHKNPTKHKYYTEYYDEETKQIVAEKYAKDIEYFGYEFGE